MCKDSASNARIVCDRSGLVRSSPNKRIREILGTFFTLGSDSRYRSEDTSEQ